MLRNNWLYRLIVLTFISENPNNINLYVVIKVRTQQETRTSW